MAINTNERIGKCFEKKSNNCNSNRSVGNILYIYQNC